jgi:hypothetical protein
MSVHKKIGCPICPVSGLAFNSYDTLLFLVKKEEERTTIEG